MAGRIGNINGYRYFYDPKHPMANAAGIVYVHRAVMSEHLGRLLGSNEVVHHRDDDRSNNALENLKLMSKVEHDRYHNRPILREDRTCPSCGDTFESAISGHLSKTYCSVQCAGVANRKVERPAVGQLAAEIETTSWCALGRKYGVTDNAIRKWARAYGLI